MEKKYIECTCSSTQHVIVFWYDSSDIISLEIQLNPSGGFFTRLIRAIKYLFGFKCKYGHWEEVLIQKKQAQEIIQILDQIK